MKTILCGGKQRARSEADKALREQQILDAAEALFTSRRFNDLKLADVAAETGLTKAALYRYFRSKEVLFLAVYRRAFESLVTDIEALSAEDFPDRFIQALLSHTTYCGLTAILHTVLETGLSTAEAREFKLFLLDQTRRLGAPIQSVTGQDEAACFEYLILCQQALIGCWHLSHPSEAVRDAIQDEPLSVFQLNFADTLSRHLRLLTDAFIAAR